MGQVISGQVLYSRTTKPGDYESEKAEVRLDFNVDDGETSDAMLTLAGTLAKNKAQELLGLRKNPTALPAQLAQPAKVAAPADAPNDKAKLAAAITGGETAAPKAAKVPKPPKAAPAPVVQEPEAAEDDDMAALLGAAPAEITDADLIAKVTDTNKRIKNPAAIKALTGKYVAFPGAVKDVPPALRAGYVAELEKLQPAG